jgi:glutathionyl-hydroquinone reductase
MNLTAGLYTGSITVSAILDLPPEPTITSVSPDTGSTAGGDTIAIIGTDLDTAYQVFIDLNGNGTQDTGEECTSANIVSATSITCVTPAGTAGAKNVVVNTWGGTATKTGGFTYYVPEEFKFTIDTRMTDTPFADGDTPATNPTHYSGTATSFSIPTGGGVGDVSHAYNWIIDWGDGSPLQPVSGTSSDSSGINHDYNIANEYQITIKSNGIATMGWMNAFGFNLGSSGANIQTNKNMFKSIDSSITDNMRSATSTYRFAHIFYGARNALTIPAGMFDSIDTTSTDNLSNMFYRTFAYYAYNSTTATIPTGLFDYINTSNATNLSKMFDGTFFYYANDSTAGDIPTGLFDSINTANAINLTGMFSNTFSSYARSSMTGTIPAGLFDYIDTDNATHLASMFNGTFAYYANDSTTGDIPTGLFDSITIAANAKELASMFTGTFSSFAYNSTDATIPTGLFDSIKTANATNLASMFSNTFAYYARSSITGTIPTGLFDSINTANATNLTELFYQTFSSFAYNSTTATIPAGPFDSITIVANAKDLTSMFNGTFSGYARNSISGTIPTGLFDYISTANATNLTSMFNGTFSSFAYGSTTGTIPTGLFDSIDTTSAINLSGMFRNTFYEYSYANKKGGTPDTDISSIWGNANFAGKMTVANAGGTSGVFYRTFYRMPSLVGTAQTFIDNKLGGIIPSSSAQTFTSTGVSDLSLLDANWK